MQIATRLSACLLTLCTMLAAAPWLAADDEDESAIYWSVSHEGRPAGFLLGTIHSEDPRVLDFAESLVGQLGSAEVFAMELVPDLPTLNRLTQYMHYQDGTTLEGRIGAERFARVRAALSEYRVPPDWIARMKVWAAMMTLSVPPPQTGLFMDFSLSLRAAGAGLRVVGLESLEQQLSFLEEMPVEQQLALLDQALDEYGRIAEVHGLMVESYLQGNLHALVAHTEEQLQELAPQARQYFIDQGIVARNRRMADALLPELAERTVFVAVGALHLPGESGLIRLLRQAGYDLAPLPLPLSAAQAGDQADDEGDGEAGDAPQGLDEDGRDAQHREQQRGSDAVAEAVGRAGVAPGHPQQPLVETELAAAVEHQRQQHDDEQQRQLEVARALRGDRVALPQRAE